MINGLIVLPGRVVKAVGALPGRLENIERSLSETQRLLAAAVEQLKTIDAHTQAMRGHTESMDEHTADLRGHAEGLGENTDRLVKIAAPLERVGRRRERRALRRAAGNGTAPEADEA